MAAFAAPKRAVVLRLAELEKYPTVRDRYIATLPYFDRNPYSNKDSPPCNCTYGVFDDSPRGCKGCTARTAFNSRQAKAITITEERWVWFSNARKVDDERGERLGTLGYLPWEIRQKIFKLIYNDHRPWEKRQKIFSFIYGDHFNENIRDRYCRSLNHKDYHYHRSTILSHTCGLQFASPSTRAEAEYIYLSKAHFRFVCPVMFTGFLNRFFNSQHSQLRSVTFQLFRKCDCLNSQRYWHELYSTPSKDWVRKTTLDWMAVFAKLPQGLTNIKFELVDWTWLPNWPELKSWPKSLRETEMFDRTLEVLETLCNQARRRAPGVHLEWYINRNDNGYLDLSQEHKDRLDNVCKNPEDWSKEWLDEWEKTQKGYEMVLNWRKQRQDWSEIMLARKSQDVKAKQ